jgi:hypothetical protein
MLIRVHLSHLFSISRSRKIGRIDGCLHYPQSNPKEMQEGLLELTPALKVLNTNDRGREVFFSDSFRSGARWCLRHFVLPVRPNAHQFGSPHSEG